MDNNSLTHLIPINGKDIGLICRGGYRISERGSGRDNCLLLKCTASAHTRATFVPFTKFGCPPKGRGGGV